MNALSDGEAPVPEGLLRAAAIADNRNVETCIDLMLRDPCAAMDERHEQVVADYLRAKPGCTWNVYGLRGRIHRLTCASPYTRERLQALTRGCLFEMACADLTACPPALRTSWLNFVPAADDAHLLLVCRPDDFDAPLDAARACGWSFERMLWRHEPEIQAGRWQSWATVSRCMLVFSRGTPVYAQTAPRGDCEHPGEGRTLRARLEFHQGLLEPFTAPHVFDPFVGDGLTLLAAESQGRQCFGFEPDIGKMQRLLHYLDRAGFDVEVA